MPVNQTDPKRDKIAKANFDQVYSMPDPREYYRTLFDLDYIIPDLAWPIFQNITSAMIEDRGGPIKVLDLGCSYGINAALLCYPVDLERLALRYRDLDDAGLDSNAIVQRDRHYFAAWPRNPCIRTLGLDVSAPAVDYATRVGLLEEGFCENLEDHDPTEALAAALADVDLVISTGCVGYVGEKTFARLLSAIKKPNPWFATFVLRMYPFDSIVRLLRQRDLGTEKLESVLFVQRRFHSDREREEVMTSLETQGLDPIGKEAEGLLLAEFFLSRPPRDRTMRPLDELASVIKGASRVNGYRPRQMIGDTPEEHRPA